VNRSTRFQIGLFVAVRIVFNTALRMVYPFLPVFGRSLGVDLAALSKALALRSVSGVLGPFLASIADSRGRKTGILFGTLIFSAGTALVVFFPTFPGFVVSIILTLLGYFAFNPSMQAYLGDHIPYERRGRALALTELGWSLSFILGVPLMGLLIARSGWLAPFSLLAILGMLSFIMMAVILPKDAARPTGQPGMWQRFGLVLTCTPALAGMLMGAAASMANELVALIFGVWLEHSFGLQIAALGIAAAVLGFAELGGELFSAGLVDRVGKSRSVAAGLVFNCLAALSIAFLGSSLTGAMSGLFLFYLTFEFVMVSSIPLMNEILPGARATVMASYVATISFGRAMGDVVAPRLYNAGLGQAHFPGMLTIAIAAILLNLGALLALRVLTRGLKARLPEISLHNA
jgi:MFS transporter, DHA1 family, inner membrane transport protein